MGSEGGAGNDDEDDSDDEEEYPPTADGTPVAMMEVKNTNSMNKSITSRWKHPQSASIPASAIGSTPVSAVPSAVGSPTVSEPGTPHLDGSQTPNHVVDPPLDPLAVDATPTALAHAAAEVAMTSSKSKKRAKSTFNGTNDTPGSKRHKISGSSEGRGGAEHAPPKIRLEDLGGVDHFIEKVKEYVMMPLAHPEIYAHMGVKPPRGILLHGPPGTGKTMMANAIAGSLGVPFITISAPSVVSGMSGESEKKIREVFEEARDLAPCLMFIDEIDAITPKRETAQREMERRIVAQLLTCMDGTYLTFHYFCSSNEGLSYNYIRSYADFADFALRSELGEHKRKASDDYWRHQPPRLFGPCPSTSWTFRSGNQHRCARPGLS